MRHSSSSAGVAADWARLPVHLGRVLPGLVVESQEVLALGRQWSFRWQGQRFELDVYVYGPDEGDRLSASRVGGELSNEKIGDIVVEFDFKPDLLWQFENVTLHLRVLATDQPGLPAGRAQVILLAKTVQSFLEASVVSDLHAVTPRLEIAMPEENTIRLGVPLRLACHAVNVAPGECHLEIRSDGFENVTWSASEITMTPARVGPVRLWLSLENTRNALRSPFAEFSFQSVREAGRPPVRVQARYLDDARIEDGPGCRLRFDRDPRSSECAMVFFIPLGNRSAVAIQFGGPRYSNAPRGIAMRLQKALLLDGSRAPVPLRPSEFHIDQRPFPDIRGTISLGSQDWEIAAVAAGSRADGPWMEELRRLGLDVAGTGERDPE
jgi:hypothetical protein